MSEITIDKTISNLNSKLAGLDNTQISTPTALNTSSKSDETSGKTANGFLANLLKFPNIVFVSLPVLLIILLIIMKPSIVTYSDPNDPKKKKLSIKKCGIYGGVAGCILGGGLFFYMNKGSNSQKKS